MGSSAAAQLLWLRYGVVLGPGGSSVTKGLLIFFGGNERTTWWFIPLSKWVITPVLSGLTPLILFITRVVTHLLSGMSHQVG